MAILMKNEEILHEKFSQYGKNAKEWMRKCALLLPEVDRHRIWEKKGFSCIYEYAAKLAGMNRNTVDDALRILRKIGDKPDLMKVAKKKGLNAVRPVATIATRNDQKFWADKARKMAVNTLRTYVRESRNVPRNNSSKKPVNTSEITMSLDKTLLAKLEKLKGQRTWNELIQQLVDEREETIEQEKPKTVKSQSAYIPVKIDKYIVRKTNGQCAFPGCTKPHKIRHHADRRSIKREHNPARIILLCHEHHRLAHLGLIKNEHLPPEHWQIRKQPEQNTYKALIDQAVQSYRS
jgi:hypothetical protein